MQDDYLNHFGVLGMHWGKHKTQSTKIHSKDSAQKNLLKKKSIHEMSNDDLTNLNRRLQLEKQYKDLTKTDISPGKKFAKDILTQVAKQTVATYVNKGINKSVESLISRRVPVPAAQ